SRGRHTRFSRDWSSDVCSSDLSPSLANGIETFNVRPRSHGFMSSEIRALFPELGPLVGYAVTALIRAEPAPLEGHRASTFAWWRSEEHTSELQSRENLVCRLLL